MVYQRRLRKPPPAAETNQFSTHSRRRGHQWVPNGQCRGSSITIFGTILGSSMTIFGTTSIRSRSRSQWQRPSRSRPPVPAATVFDQRNHSAVVGLDRRGRQRLRRQRAPGEHDGGPQPRRPKHQRFSCPFHNPPAEFRSHRPDSKVIRVKRQAAPAHGRRLMCDGHHGWIDCRTGAAAGTHRSAANHLA
jgi:hypothetical protein